MAAKKFPSDMSDIGTVATVDKIMIHDMTTGQTMWCTVAELFAALLSGAVTFSSTITSAGATLTGGLIGTTGSFSSLVTGTGALGLSTKLTSNSAGVATGLSFDMLNSSSISKHYATIQSVIVDGEVGAEYGRAELYVMSNGSLIKAANFDQGGNTQLLAVTATGITLSADNAHKPGTGGLWTVVSDERIKKDIEFADLDRCYEIVKSTPLKRYGYADGVYSDQQIKDKHVLGWIANDVQKVFPSAVSEFQFTKAEKLPDGFEEYQEQEFEIVDKDSVVIELIDGKPIQVKKVIQEKVMLFDGLPILDENGKPVIENDKPLMYSVPRMKTLQREKFRQETIDDCLDLNSGQLYAAMYGALQRAMRKIEALEEKLANI